MEIIELEYIKVNKYLSINEANCLYQNLIKKNNETIQLESKSYVKNKIDSKNSVFYICLIVCSWPVLVLCYYH